MRRPAGSSKTYIDYLDSNRILEGDCGDDSFSFIPKENPGAMEAALEGNATPAPHYAGSNPRRFPLASPGIHEKQPR
jgi:hypothetical protein